VVYETSGLDSAQTNHLSLNIGHETFIFIPQEQMELPFLSYTYFKDVSFLNDNDDNDVLMSSGIINFKNSSESVDLNTINFKFPKHVSDSINQEFTKNLNVKDILFPHLYEFSQLMRSVETMPFTKDCYHFSSQYYFMQKIIDNSFSPGFSGHLFSNYPDFYTHLNSADKTILSDSTQIIKIKKTKGQSYQWL
jgi:hypothetical protein